jgi:hypothetical protein
MVYIHALNMDESELQVTLHAVRPVFIGITQTSIPLAEMRGRRIFSDTKTLGQVIVANFIADAICSAPSLLGGLELLGNPSALVQALTRGINDAVMMPIEGLRRRSLEAVLSGIGVGATSLIRNTTQGTLASVAVFSRSVSRNLDRFHPYPSTVKGNSVSRVRMNKNNNFSCP